MAATPPNPSPLAPFLEPYAARDVPPASHPVCDISAWLRAGRHVDLDDTLRRACDETFTSRLAEQHYTDCLEGMTPVIAQGASGLALIRAWQARRPDSGHAHLMEAHHWYHWAYEYRGGGWAASVTESGWACARAAVDRMGVAALRALEREPRLWAVPAVMMQAVAAFDEPDWLARVLDGQPVPTRLAGPEDAGDAERRDMWARAGLRPDEPLVLPQAPPAALLPRRQGKKLLRGPAYWLEAAFHIHPRLYFLLRRHVWFLQPRWGGSHDRVRAFVASPRCHHLDAVEKDRLLHEVWRDAHLAHHADASDAPEAVAEAFQATEGRLARALHPYHRHELLSWLARSRYRLDQPEAALALYQRAAAEHPFEDETDLQIALRLTVEHASASRWLSQAVRDSAEARLSVSAQVLYGHFALRGREGFAVDEARGRAWLQAAFDADPSSTAFFELGHDFLATGREQDAFELFEHGHALGAVGCSRALGDMYDEARHVPEDKRRALALYETAAERGDAGGALCLAWLHRCFSDSATDDAAIARHDEAAIAATFRAMALGDDNAQATGFKYVASARTFAVRHRHIEWVRRHAQAGDAAAMSALAILHGTRADAHLYDRREAIRWLMGAQALAPEDEDVVGTEQLVRGTGWVDRLLYRLLRKGIGAHEIPGNDNAMA